ncbi:hypothetical protein [Clostridium sp. YIM B02506]|uniref:hypothetical protein n=1 Tax=Clostridium sp. YIM B02506 TaxID=2910680 RepID=UPI001EEEECD4|nr:hypothetical protein [Clostridium sp. YIM B02506]
MSNITDSIVQYSFTGRQDVVAKLNKADGFANMNATQIDTLLGLIASGIKQVAPIGITYTIAKAAAEVEVQILKSFLAQADQHSDWCIIAVSTYKFTGWGTGTGGTSGYPTYQLSKVDYHFETAE